VERNNEASRGRRLLVVFENIGGKAATKSFVRFQRERENLTADLSIHNVKSSFHGINSRENLQSLLFL
jgi:hypothetical protein